MDWFTRRGDVIRVEGSPDPGVFINMDFFGGENSINRMIVWHFHRPTNGDPDHWTGRSLGNHTLVSTDPLHLEPSLGCEDGCAFHCWIHNGKYEQA